MANFSDFGAVFTKLLSDPLYIIKPLSTFRDPDPLFFTLFLVKILGIWTYYNNWKTDNCSYVDCVWSIAPLLYSASMVLHYYVQNGILNERLTLMFFLIFGWSVRLTYNLYLKGGYHVEFEHDTLCGFHSYYMFPDDSGNSLYYSET